MSHPRAVLASSCALTLTAMTIGTWIMTGTSGVAQAATLSNTPNYSLSLALQESLYFYDAEKSGASVSLGRQPLEWRGDSELQDAEVLLAPMSDWVGTNLSASFIEANRDVLDPDGDGTVDLSGGFHDAGDHVKFGLPQSYTAATLAWGMYEFSDAYVATNTWDHAVDELTWFGDYFLRSTFTNSAGEVVAFNYQVGDGSVDHAYWGPPELQDGDLYPRPAYFATSESPASDQTAGASAALAATYLVLRDSDPDYAEQCLTAAEALYAFSVANRGLGYSGGFYGSSFDEDEMSWAAIWLYLATGTHSYVDDILATDSDRNYTGYMSRIINNSTDGWNNIWVHSWDTKWGGVFSLLDPVVQGDSEVPELVQSDIHYFDKWHVEYWSQVEHDDANDTTFLATSPGGYQVLSGWGSARYNTAAQLTALAYRNHFPDDPKSELFTDWAMGQMNYLMGDNPLDRSYIVGFGSTEPGGVGELVGGSAEAAQHPHHAAAHGSTTNNQDDPTTHRHTLWGGLVGGPDLEDQHDDLTTDYVYNEVAIDYNAALVGALAGLYEYYGADQVMTDFTPPLEEETDDYYAYGEVNQVNSASSQVTVTINNFGSRPPHYQTDMSARYYFDISEIYAQGQDISAVSTAIYYDSSDGTYGQPASISDPVRWGGEDSCVYYVTLDWTGAEVFGARELQFGLIEAQTSNWKTYWDPTNDYSFTGLEDGAYESTMDPYLPVYLSGELVYGEEPSTTLNETCGASTGGGETGTPTLTAQYSTSTTTDTTTQITNSFQLTNTGTVTADLSKVTIRYWFTAETTGDLVYACDYTPLGCDNVTGTFETVDPAVSGADRYLELGFGSGAGILTPGNETGAIQNRVQQAAHGIFTQTDDYSFDPSATSLTTWDHITVYYDGELVFGTPPA